MGFNAARVEWAVDGISMLNIDVSTEDCDIATTDAIRATLLPPTTADTPQPAGNPSLPQNPPTSGHQGGVCSSDLPTTSTRDRYVYLVHYLCGQVSIGFTLHQTHSISLMQTPLHTWTTPLLTSRQLTASYL